MKTIQRRVNRPWQPELRFKGPKELTYPDWGRFFARLLQKLDAYPSVLEFKEPSFWVELLSEQPQFADKCPWDKLKDRHWARLLCSQPQFEKYKPRTL